MVLEQTIIWRRLDKPGHESARLFYQDSLWYLNGATVFVHDGQPCSINYRLKCDSQWQTISGKIRGWVGDQGIGFDISVDSARRWWLNGVECVEVRGCIDLDLNFSPSTNLIPIRRLNLAVGQKGDVRAAWLRFPSFKFEPLDPALARFERRRLTVSTTATRQSG